MRLTFDYIRMNIATTLIMDLGSQIILTSNTGEFRVDFKEQLNIKGTKIGFKSLYHPRLITPRKYSFHVKARKGKTEEIVLPRQDYHYYSTEELLYDVDEAYKKFLQTKNRAAEIFHVQPDDIEKTTTIHFSRSYSIVKAPLPAFLLELNLPLTFGIDIFELIPAELVTLTNSTLEVKHYIFPGDVERLELAYLTCDIIVSNYVNNTKKHVLEVLNLSSEHPINVIQKENPVFFDVCVDEIISLNVSMKSLDGHDLHFSKHHYTDLVLVLECQNS